LLQASAVGSTEYLKDHLTLGCYRDFLLVYVVSHLCLLF